MGTRASEYIRKIKSLLLHPTAQFIGLNAVRVLSLIALILVLSSSIVDMDTNVKAVNAFDIDDNESALVDCEYIEGSSVPNQPAGVFWAYMASLLLIFQMIILSLSELGWNTDFFNSYFPVLGSNFGLGILGIFQCLISTQILSHFVEDFTLVSACFLFVLGCLNIVLGLIFRESAKAKRSINPWRRWRTTDKVKGDLPALPASSSRGNRRVFINNLFSSSSSLSETITPYVMHQDTNASDNGTWRSTEVAGYGRHKEKSAGSNLPKPAESLPPGYTAASSSSPVSEPTFKSSSTAI